MHDYYYTLVRFVPDLERMEPTNVGVILQGSGKIDIRISRHAAKRKDIDTTIFQQWRAFLTEEVQGEPTPLFQPPRSSPKFLDYLAKLCEGSVVLSQPMIASVDASISFDELLSRLYQRLVAPPPAATATEANRPTGRFRQLSEKRLLVRRGMKRHAPVKVDSNRHWLAYRHVLNGSVLAIDKVEVGNQIGATANEIQAMNSVLFLIPEFVAGTGWDRPTKYFFLADTLDVPFTDQPGDEFQTMRDDLEDVVKRVQNSGGVVLRNPADVELLIDELDRTMPLLDPSHTEIIE